MSMNAMRSPIRPRSSNSNRRPYHASASSRSPTSRATWLMPIRRAITCAPGALAARAGGANFLGHGFGGNAEFAVLVGATEGYFELAEEAPLGAFALLGHRPVGGHLAVLSERRARLQVDPARRGEGRTGHRGDRRHERLELPGVFARAPHPFPSGDDFEADGSGALDEEEDAAA